MQALQVAGFAVFACGAVLFVLPRVLPIRGRGRRGITRASLAAFTLGLMLIIGPLIMGLIGHAIMYPTN
jgi:hypothetical protein